MSFFDKTKVMIAQRVHTLTKQQTKQRNHDCTKSSFIDQKTQNKNVMIARKVHHLTNQCHDCTKSSFIDKKTKTKKQSHDCTTSSFIDKQKKAMIALTNQSFTNTIIIIIRSWLHDKFIHWPNKNVMIALKVHYLTKQNNNTDCAKSSFIDKTKKSHDCTKSSFIDQKTMVMIARQVHPLTKNKKTQIMIARKVHSLTRTQIKSWVHEKFILWQQQRSWLHEMSLLTKNKNHDCTTSSFIDKNKIMIARKVHYL